MPEQQEQPVIGYGTTFSTFFFGASADMRVISPVNHPLPKVDVTLSVGEKAEQQSVEVEGAFFENLLSLLNSIKEHTDLLSGSESSFFKDASAILFSDLPPAKVMVTRAKKTFGGIKDEVFITIGELSLKRELNDAFFQEVVKLQKAIQQAKQVVSSRIESYLSNK